MLEMPVVLFSDLAKLAIRPAPTGSMSPVITSGVAGAICCAARTDGIVVTIITRDSGEGREARVVGFCPEHVEQIVASFEKAVLTHTLPECIDEYRARRCKAATQHSDHRHRRLLRGRSERPRHRAAKKRG